MYPDEQILMEVGRISIAAGRLDADLGALWYQLAPDLVDELKARRAQAGKVRDNIRALANQRLDPTHCGPLVAFVDEAEAAQTERNGVMHSRWLLRGQDATRPVSEFLTLSEEERSDYMERWEREAVASEGWRRQANDSMDLGEPQHLDELIAIERRLANASHVAQRWSFQIASMRELKSPGWQGPSSARRGPQTPPPGAVTGDAAIAQLDRFLKRMADNRDD
jgi:hypothetical protein